MTMPEFPFFPPTNAGNGEALPKGSLILITGASGMLGSHVVQQCLAFGYRVRGTTRDTEKNSWMSNYFENKFGPDVFEAVAVKDMGVEGAYDAHLQGMNPLRSKLGLVD
jgi:NADPH:quinone reductase-like Zn-dependent oxidoreductase